MITMPDSEHFFDRDDYIDVRREMMNQFTRLPLKGTRVADMTEQEKFALALAAGVPYDSDMVGTKLTLKTSVPVGFADRGDGGWIIAIGPKPFRRG